MQVTPKHIIGGFAAGAAITGGATIASGFAGKDGDISPWVFAPAAVGITGLSGGMVYGAKYAATNPMLGAAIFATGLGAAGGFLYGLPVAVGIAQNRG